MKEAGVRPVCGARHWLVCGRFQGSLSFVHLLAGRQSSSVRRQSNGMVGPTYRVSTKLKTGGERGASSKAAYPCSVEDRHWSMPVLVVQPAQAVAAWHGSLSASQPLGFLPSSLTQQRTGIPPSFFVNVARSNPQASAATMTGLIRTNAADFFLLVRMRPVMPRTTPSYAQPGKMGHCLPPLTG